MWVKTPSPTSGTQQTTDVPRLNSNCRIPQLAPVARPQRAGRPSQGWSAPFQGRSAAGTPRPTHSGDGKQTQVRLGQSCQWKTSFWAKHGPCLWRRVIFTRARGAHPTAAQPAAGCRGCAGATPRTCPQGSALPLASVRAHPQVQRCLSPPRVDVPCATLAAELGLSWGPDWQVLL